MYCWAAEVDDYRMGDVFECKLQFQLLNLQSLMGLVKKKYDTDRV